MPDQLVADRRILADVDLLQPQADVAVHPVEQGCDLAAALEVEAGVQSVDDGARLLHRPEAILDPSLDKGLTRLAQAAERAVVEHHDLADGRDRLRRAPV